MAGSRKSIRSSSGRDFLNSADRLFPVPPARTLSCRGCALIIAATPRRMMGWSSTTSTPILCVPQSSFQTHDSKPSLISCRRRSTGNSTQQLRAAFPARCAYRTCRPAGLLDAFAHAHQPEMRRLCPPALLRQIEPAAVVRITRRRIRSVLEKTEPPPCSAVHGAPRYTRLRAPP
jgi:hypothetical protein